MAIAVSAALRLPALVQPMGPDQGIYAYVGQRILAGDLPYRDAWDHKPPGLHFAYALMWWLWPDDGVVALVDLGLALAVAGLLMGIASRLTAADTAGGAAAFVLLLLGNPAFGRLGGVRVRGQGEVFIGALVAAAVWMALRTTSSRGASHVRRTASAVAAGLLIGAACVVKYQAAIFMVVCWVAMHVPYEDASPPMETRRPPWRLMAWSLAGFMLPLSVMAALFALGGALPQLWDATVLFNLQYSGESYADWRSAVQYLGALPFRQARVDGLWLLGGAGSAVLAWMSLRRWWLSLPVIWIALACLAIAANGSRGLPQYFVQAAPALALAAGIGWAELSTRLSRRGRVVALAVITLALVRVVSFPKLLESTSVDVSRALGRIDTHSYLSRFGGRPGDKYAAADLRLLATRLKARSRPGESVYVFGFSSGAYVYSQRRSASRLFFLTPVVSTATWDRPGYGPVALLSDLSASRPRVIALQRNDGGPTWPESREWFLSQPTLGPWLMAHYSVAESLDRYEIWEILE